MQVFRRFRRWLGRKGSSFRKPLIQLEIVERADRIFVAEVDILGELEALEALEFAEVGAVGAFEAEVIALEEGGLFLGVGVTEGVGAGGGVEELGFEFEAALHVPGGGEEAVEGEVLEVAGGLEGAVEVVAEGVEFGAVLGGDDGMEAGEAVFGGVAGGGSFTFGGVGSGTIRHGLNSSFRREIKKDQGVSSQRGWEKTHWSSQFREYHGGNRMSRGKDGMGRAGGSFGKRLKMRVGG